MYIWYSSRFRKSFKELPKTIQKSAVMKIEMFQIDPKDKRLFLHPLTGKLKSYFSFRVNYRYRILFRFDDNGDALLADIGTHSIYR